MMPDSLSHFFFNPNIFTKIQEVRTPDSPISFFFGIDFFRKNSGWADA
jgi:hypothetical protein